MARYATLNDQDRETLKHLAHAAVWDGNLISKRTRDRLVDYGLVINVIGLNRLTKAGQVACVALGYLVEETEIPF
jgi:hypothetical protein